MSKYDRSVRTTSSDVAREASEAGAEISQAASAVVDALGGAGDGTLADAAREAGEAVAAAGEAIVAAADLAVDTATEAAASVKGWFQTVLGYRLHDSSPENDKAVLPTEPVEMVRNGWIESQIAAGLVKEVDAPAAPAPVAEVVVDSVPQ